MSELSKRMRELADKSTPGPWVNLKGRFWDAMRAFKKKTRKWWHGNQRSCYPLSLICIDDHYGKPISDNDLAQGFPDWWDLKKVVGVRLSDTKRDYAAAGHINDEDADFIAECRAGVPALCDEVERLEADNALLDRNFRNLQTRLDAIHDFASRCDVEQKNEPDEIITAMIDGIRSVARFIEDDADGYANAMRRRIDALEKENAEIRAEVEILRRERSLLIKKGDSQ